MSLLSDMAFALEPAGLMEKLGLAPDPWQRELLDLAPRRCLMRCGRQTGKSTTTAVVALHEAIYHAPALVLLLSPSLRQSSELFRKVASFYHALPMGLEAVQESALRLEFQNGSRVVSLPGSEATVRGYSAASLLIIDEAARCSDELIAAAKPALATTDGRLVALSTPWGRRGWFYHEWLFGEGWHRTLLRTTECPRIKPEFLAEERKQLGEFLYSQEYLCEFVDNETSVFSSALVEAALDEGVKPLWT